MLILNPMQCYGRKAARPRHSPPHRSRADRARVDAQLEVVAWTHRVFSDSARTPDAVLIRFNKGIRLLLRMERRHGA